MKYQFVIRIDNKIVDKFEPENLSEKELKNFIIPRCPLYHVDYFYIQFEEVRSEFDGAPSKKNVILTVDKIYVDKFDRKIQVTVKRFHEA